jgi:hypothetical protein
MQLPALPRKPAAVDGQLHHPVTAVDSANKQLLILSSWRWLDLSAAAAAAAAAGVPLQRFMLTLHFSEHRLLFKSGTQWHMRTATSSSSSSTPLFTVSCCGAAWPSKGPRHCTNPATAEAVLLTHHCQLGRGHLLADSTGCTTCLLGPMHPV